MRDNVAMNSKNPPPWQPEDAGPLPLSSGGEKSPYSPQLHVVLCQPEIPQNTGNIGRTCLAVGAKLWLVRPLGFRIDDHHLARAGMDYWPQLQWQAVDSWDALAGELDLHSAWYFTKTASRAVWDASFAVNDVLVFGSESAGLPPSLLAANRDRALLIPMRGDARSLNLASSVAVGVYEARRQMALQDPIITRWGLDP